MCWPLSLSFTLLDTAAVNATVIWTSIHPPIADDPLSRRHDQRRRLLIELGENLAKPWLAERSSIQQVICHPEVRAAMKRVGAISDQHTDAQPKDNRKRGRCFLCPRSKEQKGYLHCSYCQKLVCCSHSSAVKTVTCLSCCCNS